MKMPLLVPQPIFSASLEAKVEENCTLALLVYCPCARFDLEDSSIKKQVPFLTNGTTEEVPGLGTTEVPWEQSYRNMTHCSSFESHPPRSPVKQ
jgi:hypothetical protein